jgi:hypothetical protein
LIEREAEGAPQKKRKGDGDPLLRLADVAAKALRDNFKKPVWDERRLNLHVVQGMSLRQRVEGDLRQKLLGQRLAPMGKLYYQELRLLYGGPMGGEEAAVLAVLDDTEEIPQDMAAALEGITARRKRAQARNVPKQLAFPGAQGLTKQ